jgi:uncharacterized membrane protein YccC
MKRFKQLIVVLALGLGLIGLQLPAKDRGRDYSDLRGVVDRTQSDLRNASDLEHGNKQRDRYHNAQDNLSKFDRNLSKGKFDKGALEHALHGLKDILDHNTLQASARDTLRRDFSELRTALDLR